MIQMLQEITKVLYIILQFTYKGELNYE